MNILAIGAHFDDVELGCGGALAKHIINGDQVTVYVATQSGYANEFKEPVRSNTNAAAEGQNAMDILGVQNLITGSFETFALEFSDPLNVELLKVLKSKSFDLVYTHWVADAHHDHIVLARASLHCCRHVPRVLMYRSNWYQSTVSFNGNFHVDISAHWPTKLAAIEAHATEVTRTRGNWLNFWEQQARSEGLRVGVEFAEAFEVVKWRA